MTKRRFYDILHIVKKYGRRRDNIRGNDYIRVSDHLDPAVYPKAAIEAIRNIEAEAEKPKSNVTGFKIKYDSNNGRLCIEKGVKSLAFKGYAKNK